MPVQRPYQSGLRFHNMLHSQRNDSLRGSHLVVQLLRRTGQVQPAHRLFQHGGHGGLGVILGAAGHGAVRNGGQREQQAHGHDAERQHTGGGGTGAAAQCFLKFDGSDTEQLLSFYSLEYDAGLPIPAVARSFFTQYSGAAVRLFTSM